MNRTSSRQSAQREGGFLTALAVTLWCTAFALLFTARKAAHR
jgi:hypothetical protein